MNKQQIELLEKYNLKKTKEDIENIESQAQSIIRQIKNNIKTNIDLNLYSQDSTENFLNSFDEAFFNLDSKKIELIEINNKIRDIFDSIVEYIEYMDELEKDIEDYKKTNSNSILKELDEKIIKQDLKTITNVSFLKEDFESETDKHLKNLKDLLQSTTPKKTRKIKP